MKSWTRVDMWWSTPLRTWVTPRMWSSIAHENSIDGYTRNLVLVLGCGRSEILNMTLSRNAGSVSCMLVFSRTVVEPCFAVNIWFHLLIWTLGVSCRHVHSLPLILRSCISSWVQWQT